MAEILGDVSHDSVNRFLLRERYEPKDLFDIVTEIINLSGGILSVDDTVIEKLYSNPKYAELIGYFWSGKYHKTIKGLNLITLYYSDIHGNSVPINYINSGCTGMIKKPQRAQRVQMKEEEEEIYIIPI